MKRKISLKAQISLSLIVFVIFVLGLIFGFQTVFTDNIYKANKIESLKVTGNDIVENLKDDDFDGFIKTITLDRDVCVSIVSGTGTTIDSSRKNACVLSNLTTDQINDIASETSEAGGSKLFDNYYLFGPNRDDLYIYSILTTYDSQPLMVLVSTTVTPITAVTSTMTSQYWIIALIVVIATIIFSFVLSRIIIKPLNRIKEESRLLPLGKYDCDSISTSNEEMSELNKTLGNANSEIQKADVAKKELIANVSHDLRTPLTMIVGYGEMIRDLPDESDSENAAIIVEEAKRLSALVDDLLDVSKDNQLRINPEETDLNDLLKNVYNQYEKYCESMKVKFNLVLSDDIKVMLDEKRIKQVLYNFINNSLNYNTKDEKEITLGVEKYNGLYRVYVKDNGDGIKKEDMVKIWDRYYKVDKEHKRTHLGSGIGLALARNILEIHGFGYGVDSEFGKYSKFYFDVKAIKD